jgi:hypothetical protein
MPHEDSSVADPLDSAAVEAENPQSGFAISPVPVAPAVYFQLNHTFSSLKLCNL